MYSYYLSILAIYVKYNEIATSLNELDNSMYNLGMAMKKLSTVRENKGSVESKYAPRQIAQVVTVSSVNDIFNEELRHRSLISVFPPQCEGPISYQTMPEDQVVHTGQDNSESERDSKNSTDSVQLKVSI